MHDRHKLWRRVAYDATVLQEIAPEGFETRVYVFVAHREAPIKATYVETHRDADDPWVRIQVEGAEPGVKADRDSYWVHVLDHLIMRVEIHFERTETAPLGFGYGVRESDPTQDSDESD